MHQRSLRYDSHPYQRKYLLMHPNFGPTWSIVRANHCTAPVGRHDPAQSSHAHCVPSAVDSFGGHTKSVDQLFASATSSSRREHWSMSTRQK